MRGLASVWFFHEVFVDGPAISGRNRDLPVFIAAASNVSAAAPQRDGDRRENGLPPELAKGVELEMSGSMRIAAFELRS